MIGKVRNNLIVLSNPADIVLHPKIAEDIFRVCEENDVPLSQRYKDLLKLLQVPKIAYSMSARLLEVERIFKKEVNEYFENT